MFEFVRNNRCHEGPHTLGITAVMKARTLKCKNSSFCFISVDVTTAASQR